MNDVRTLRTTSEYFKNMAIATLAFQINRHNDVADSYTYDAEEIVDSIIKSVQCNIKIALIEEGLIKETK